MEQINNQSWVSYESFYMAINSLPDKKDQLDLWNQIAEYGLYEKENPDLSPIAKAVFYTIKAQIDANLRKRKNGKLGGRPKKTIGLQDENHRLLTEKPKVIETETIGYEDKNLRLSNQKPNVNVNDNVNENVNDNEKDNVYIYPRQNIVLRKDKEQDIQDICFNYQLMYPKVLDDYSEYKEKKNIQCEDDYDSIIDFLNTTD